MQRDMAVMAESKLREAIEVDATYAPGRLLLARLSIEQGKLNDAEAQFRKVLEVQAWNDEATLGLAEVQVRRGGPAALAAAEQQLAPLLASRSDWPRARYVNGLLHETRGDSAKAAAEFKAATELLLREAETHTPIASSQPPTPDDG
jgi:cytochrome c-type biogenesis protein CcmH/NrfG